MKRVLMYDTKGVAYPNKTKNICTDTNDSIRPAQYATVLFVCPDRQALQREYTERERLETRD